MISALSSDRRSEMVVLGFQKWLMAWVWLVTNTWIPTSLELPPGSKYLRSDCEQHIVKSSQNAQESLHTFCFHSVIPCQSPDFHLRALTWTECRASFQEYSNTRSLNLTEATTSCCPFNPCFNYTRRTQWQARSVCWLDWNGFRFFTGPF